MEKYCVYRHTSPSGKHYIGITCQQVERRWRKDGSGYKDSPVFFNAIKKYGWDAFKHEILFSNLTYEEAEALEIKLIAECKSTERAYGYNSESGGKSGKHLSSETKRKLSQANKGKDLTQLRTGYRQWIEAGGTLKGTHGVKHTQEWKAIMSQRMSGKNNPAYGKDYSYLRKSYATNRSGKEHPNARSINQYTLDGKYVASYDTIQSVAEHFGKQKASDVSNVTACANGRRKTAYGYIWKYPKAKGDDNNADTKS